MSNGKKIVYKGRKIESIEESNPEVLEYWDYEKNDRVGIYPEDFSKGSHQKVWWKCSECGKSFEREIRGVIESLAITNPELAKEWNYNKNGDLTPFDVVKGSNKKVWWILPYDDPVTKKHFILEWQASINSRNSGANCPYISKPIKKVYKGLNDLETLNPELIKEWDYDKNKELKPSELSPYSNKKVWWKCSKCGYQWEATPHNRNKLRKATNCPNCAKALQISFPELAIFYYIKEIFKDAISGYKDLGFELDIYIPLLKVGIEYDGENWHTDINKDLIKDNLCIKNKIQLIRIREPRCPNFNSSSKVYKLITKKEDELEKVIKNLLNDLNINSEKININIDKDRMNISSCIFHKEIKDSLKFQNEKLAQEWHPSKNGNIKPENVKPHSHKKVWWLGVCGHEWQAPIYSRNTKKINCPICSGKRILKGYNDLTTTNPKLAKEWNYNKNGNLTPDKVNSGSHKKVWWRGVCGHEWQAPIYSRNVGKSCPYCSNRLTLTGYNDLQTKYPDLIKEWNYNKNGNLMPDKVSYGSHKKVWWIDKDGHEWEQRIDVRVKNSKKESL